MGKPKIKTIEYNPAAFSRESEKAHGYRNVRWVENVSCGLRKAGFADEIARKEGSRSIEHKGWFTDEDNQDEVYRGVVYQLPSRKGYQQYVYGYADPNNEDCALLCFEPFTDKLEAAKQADRFAEIFAEDARDYNRAWQAGRRYDDLETEIGDTRKEALDICAEMRAAKRVEVKAPTICATLRKQVIALYRRIQKMRKERKELLNTFGQCDGFVE